MRRYDFKSLKPTRGMIVSVKSMSCNKKTQKKYLI